jgi:hypothetical protein
LTVNDFSSITGSNLMTSRRLAILAILGLVTLAGYRLGAATPQMPISEIRPGMVGIGHTVFNGTKVEEFRANIIGVVENVIGTRRNLILAKLEGGPLAQTGVIAGMSGSPVYVDGRLIGAVSYSLGSFSKEPIAGITPIEEMTEAAALTTPRPAAARVHLEFPLTRDNLVAAFRRALNWNRPFAERAGDAQLVGVDAVAGLGAQVATLLRPIATPLVMSGFETDFGAMLGAAFQDQGFIPTGAGAALRPGDMPFEGPLKPGDALGVNFVSGDVLLGATGTVTHIDGDHVYGFGHPMYNLGPTRFPMTRAYVYTVLPSLFSSTKLSTTNEVIGTVLQDRATTIAGRLGPGPALIPVTLTLESEQHATKRTFNFGVVKDQLFTPLMSYSALVNTLLSYERQLGTATFAVTGSARLRDHGEVAFDNLFSGGDSPAMNAASSVIAPITALLTNDDEAVEIERLDLTMKASEEPRTATLQRVWIDDPRPRAGRPLPLKVHLRTYRGEDVLRSVPIEIPATARGNLSIVVSDGLRLGQAEQREARSNQPRTIEQLVRTLNKGRKNNTLYVKLMSGDAGAVVNGELMSSLPPSVLAVLEADRSGGSFNPLYSATLGEWEIPTTHAVTGVRTLTIGVTPN